MKDDPFTVVGSMPKNCQLIVKPLPTDAEVEATRDMLATKGKDALLVRALEYRYVDRPRPLVTVVQALPKSERSELVVELATEAGADVIVPWQSSRSVARWVGSKADKGVAKWRGAAATAAKQSRRAWLPEVSGMASTTTVRRVGMSSRCTTLMRLGGVEVLVMARAPGRRHAWPGPRARVIPAPRRRLRRACRRQVATDCPV